ncbi:MAG TPA: hypothetical protein DCS29_01065 [Candidatus Magasanikbacteria bacterium]|nr:hypothetical protein [Candidatus Magasanikbacteria bacterium]
MKKSILFVFAFLAACNGNPYLNQDDNSTTPPVQREPTPDDVGLTCFTSADCYAENPDTCETRTCANGECIATDEVQCGEPFACWLGACVIKEHECSNVDDGNPCTVDVCDNMTGNVKRYAYTCPIPSDPLYRSVCKADDNGERVCVEEYVGVCDANDGSLCTTDLCDVNGNPVYVGFCDDGMSNTQDSCDEATGHCGHMSLPPACLNSCESADPCVVPTCNWETEECEFAPLCDPESQWCDVGICRQLCTSNQDCFDSNACTLDQCLVNGHCANTSLSCDDANDDTFDTCDAASGCHHIEVIEGDPQCVESDGNVCTVATMVNGTCVEIDPCGEGTVCQPYQGLLAHCAPAVTASECTEGAVVCYDFVATGNTSLARCTSGMWVEVVTCGSTSVGATECQADPAHGCSQNGGTTWFGWSDVIGG